VNRGDVILAADTDGLSDNVGVFMLDHLKDFKREKNRNVGLLECHSAEYIEWR
jgi:hypothetical protein